MPVYFGDNSYLRESFKADLNKSLVTVRCGHTWGTGLIINKHKGIVITCSKVFSYNKGEDIYVKCGKFNRPAEVLYANKPGTVYDIAVLKTEPLLSLKEMPLTYVTPRKGETVYAAGYPEINQLKFSRGVVTNVAPDVLLQTTCCVLSGSLGGPVIDLKGRLIGISVSSNIYCPGILSVYNHRNLAVPITAFSTILTKYLQTEDTIYLRRLTTENPLIIREWELFRKLKAPESNESMPVTKRRV